MLSLYHASFRPRVFLSLCSLPLCSVLSNLFSRVPLWMEFVPQDGSGSVTLGDGTVLIRGPKVSLVLITEHLCDDYIPWMLAGVYSMASRDFSGYSHAALGSEVESR